MNTFLRKNFAVLLAFLLPIVLIGAVALSTYLPSLFISTGYDFIYASCTEGGDYYSYPCGNYLQKQYSVVNDRLVRNPINPLEDADQDTIPDIDETDTARIFLHDTEKNESREITVEEAQRLRLNGLLTSPDGVTVSGDYDRGADFFLLFSGNSSYGRYLTKGNNRTKLNLIGTDDRYYYQNNFQFIGWVLP